MNLKQLKKVAFAMDFDQAIIDDADDADYPKSAVNQLISGKWSEENVIFEGLLVKAAQNRPSPQLCIHPKCTPAKNHPAFVRWDIFCSHTKQSSRWSCEDFVRDHIWGFFEPLGVRTFYDRVALVGSPIHECMNAAAHTKVMLVVLDDKSPSSRMLDEIKVALDRNISVQTIYCGDKFSWEEVGKPAWEQQKYSRPRGPWSV